MSKGLFISFLVISFLAIVSSQNQFHPQNAQRSQLRTQPLLSPPQTAQQPRPQLTQPQPRPQSSLKPLQPQRIPARQQPQQPQAGPQTPRYVPFNIPAPPAQSPSSYIYGHHKIIDPSTNQLIYHHYYNTDNNSHHEARSWFNTGNKAAEPIVTRALADPFQVQLTNQPKPAPREVNYQSPFQPAPLTNFNYQPNRQPIAQRNVDQQDHYRRSPENSIEFSSPVISRYSSPSWLQSIEGLISYIKSPNFISQVGKLGSHSSFKTKVVSDKSAEDDKLIGHNNDHSGLNFTLKDDCKPKMTTIKLGSPERPEIIYNPSSVEILRCPQACFSWQFDCIPTQKATYNFTVATYFTTGDAINRKVELFTIESHVACACQCQSLASCLGDVTFSPQRLPPTP